MIIVLSVIAGLVWGSLFALAGSLLTKKMVSGDARLISSMSIVRTLLDVVALAAVYFTRNLVPLRFEVTLISAAVALSLISIITAFRTAAALKDR